MTYHNTILNLVLRRTDPSWRDDTQFIVSTYYDKSLPSGANLRFDGLRHANDRAQLNIGFIPHDQSACPIEFRALFSKSPAWRRVASMLLQIALRKHTAVFDSVPFLPFQRHHLLIHDSGNLFAGARRSNRLRSTVFRSQLKFVRNFVSVSVATARLLRLTGHHVPTIISPNATGFQPVSPSGERDIDFLFVSSGAHHKRDAQAYRLLRQAFPEARIVLAGHQLEMKIGSELDKLAQFANSPRDAELANLFGRSRVYITWSRVEGYGMTVLEALASGCQCIVTNIPCFRELFHSYPQVAFVRTKGLKSDDLKKAWQLVCKKQGPMPPEPSWEELLRRLHEDLSRAHPSSSHERTPC